mgnify:CR=1 FL=1
MSRVPGAARRPADAGPTTSRTRPSVRFQPAVLAWTLAFAVLATPAHAATWADPAKTPNFKNFHFKAEVLTTPGSNSGIYFATRFQPEGWPKQGYEVQVNNTHTDPKKTGGLYGVSDVFEAPAKDGKWFEMHIAVQGKHVTVKVDGKTVVDYTEPADKEVPKEGFIRVISEGTFALQAHDPKSEVHYRNIRVKKLP